ncbi:Centrosomal protein of 19 kDa [Entophlyctis luteolus]|nr:Centrosomal protein of 19 kDa [Entophlyctis luteolus]
MRQRYRDQAFGYLDGNSQLKRYSPRNIGGKFNPPVVYLFFEDLDTGKYYRRKMPVRELLDCGKMKCSSSSADQIARDFVEKHDVLKNVPFSRVRDVIAKIQTNLNLPQKTPQSLFSTLPSLPAKETDKDYNNSRKTIDGRIDLNKLSDKDLIKVKEEMNKDFEKNRITPDHPDFKYDVQPQVEFGVSTEANDWDEASADSLERTASLKRSGQWNLQGMRVGELETDRDDTSLKDEISEIEEEISQILDKSGEASGKLHSDKSLEKDEESLKVSSTAFWWMKENKESDVKPTASISREVAGGSMSADVEPPEVSCTPTTAEQLPPSILVNSGLSATLAALQKSRALLADNQTHSPAVAEQPLSSSKLGPLPSLSKATTHLPQFFSRNQDPKTASAPQSTVLDVDDQIDEEIDAEFENYDPDADGGAPDFLDLIMPQKASVEQLLPFSKPITSDAPALTEIVVTKSVQDVKPQPTMTAVTLKAENTPENAPARSIIQVESKSSPNASNASFAATTDGTFESETKIQREKVSTGEDAKSIFESDNLKILRPFDSLASGPKHESSLLGGLPPIAPNTGSQQSKKNENEENFGSSDIPEEFNFEFEGSVSDLLEDNGDIIERPEFTKGGNSNVMREILGARDILKTPETKAKMSILDKFAEGAKEIESPFTNRDDSDFENYGAGDTDSEIEVNGNSLRKQTRNVAFRDEDSEIENLFNNEEVMLDVDGGDDFLYENDEF